MCDGRLLDPVWYLLTVRRNGLRFPPNGWHQHRDGAHLILLVLRIAAFGR